MYITTNTYSITIKMEAVSTLFHNKSNLHIFMRMPDLYPDQMIDLACTPFPATFPGILQSVPQVCHILWKKAQG